MAGKLSALNQLKRNIIGHQNEQAAALVRMILAEEWILLVGHELAAYRASYEPRFPSRAKALTRTITL